MQEFKKRPQKAHYTLRFGAALLATLFLFAVSGAAVSSAWGMYGTFKVAVGARESAEQGLVALQKDEARISATVASFDTPEGTEREIRERFGVAKPQEGEIQIVRDGKDEENRLPANENIFLKTLRSFFIW